MDDLIEQISSLTHLILERIYKKQVIILPLQGFCKMMQPRSKIENK